MKRKSTVSWGVRVRKTSPNTSCSMVASGFLYAFYQQRTKLRQKKENAIPKIENKLKQKNLIMYQVGDGTPGRKALFQITREHSVLTVYPPWKTPEGSYPWRGLCEGDQPDPSEIEEGRGDTEREGERG